MATFPQRLKGGYISVLVGDGANPEVYTKICGATSKGFTYQKNTTDDVLDPCDDPEAIPSRVLQVTGRQWDIALNIVYNRTQAALIRDLMASSDSSNFRFEFSEPVGSDAVDAGYWFGKAQVTNFQVTGEGNAAYASGTMAIASDGEWIWVDA